QVLSGVTFAAREQQALTIDFEPTGSSYTASIHDCGGRARYRAVLATETDSAPTAAVPQIVGSAWPMSVEDAYASPLFHGPQFAAIEH
ncbi:hypothetical protein C6A85_63860, partial [Mycobacterium sp. ITM-2017-0098]